MAALENVSLHNEQEKVLEGMRRGDGGGGVVDRVKGVLVLDIARKGEEVWVVIGLLIDVVAVVVIGGNVSG